MTKKDLVKDFTQILKDISRKAGLSFFAKIRIFSLIRGFKKFPEKYQEVICEYLKLTLNLDGYNLKDPSEMQTKTINAITDIKDRIKVQNFMMPLLIEILNTIFNRHEKAKKRK